VFARNRRLDESPTLVDMDVIDAVKDGSIEVVAAVESFETDKVALIDGTRVNPDTVIAATGYSRDLQPLVGHLKVLDAGGRPVVMGETAATIGLRFIGYRTRPSLIGYFAKQSRRIAKRIVDELEAE
jgi:hypothetical protein